MDNHKLLEVGRTEFDFDKGVNTLRTVDVPRMRSDLSGWLLEDANKTPHVVLFLSGDDVRDLGRPPEFLQDIVSGFLSFSYELSLDTLSGHSKSGPQTDVTLVTLPSWDDLDIVKNFDLDSLKRYTGDYKVYPFGNGREIFGLMDEYQRMAVAMREWKWKDALINGMHDLGNIWMDNYVKWFTAKPGNLPPVDRVTKVFIDRYFPERNKEFPLTGIHEYVREVVVSMLTGKEELGRRHGPKAVLKALAENSSPIDDFTREVEPKFFDRMKGRKWPKTERTRDLYKLMYTKASETPEFSSYNFQSVDHIGLVYHLFDVLTARQDVRNRVMARDLSKAMREGKNKELIVFMSEAIRLLTLHLVNDLVNLGEEQFREKYSRK
jgi:hypothetical protein